MLASENYDGARDNLNFILSPYVEGPGDFNMERADYVDDWGFKNAEQWGALQTGTRFISAELAFVAAGGILSSVKTASRLLKQRPGIRSHRVDSSTIPADKRAGVYNASEGYRKNPTARVLTNQIDEFGKVRVNRKAANGDYMFVVDVDGRIIIGTRDKMKTASGSLKNMKNPHPTLIGGRDPHVQSAGMVNFRDGRIYSVNNASGHFKPTRGSLAAAKNAFNQLPEAVFRKNFQGYKMWWR